MNIAIDGPAGAGKSTLAKELAKELGFIHLDTGAMYRAFALKAHALGLDCKDESNILPIIDSTTIDIVHENGNQRVILDDKDVSDEIRQNYVSRVASDISALKCVRMKLVELQREIASKQNTVLDGRDIGSFVLPNAEFKFFVTASIDQRAMRRFKELTQKGIECDIEQIKKEIVERDYNDANREFAPLKIADDAQIVDTTEMNIDEVLAFILKIVKKSHTK